MVRREKRSQSHNERTPSEGARLRKYGRKEKCERQESNLHTRRYWNLNPARLPVPPLSRSCFITGHTEVWGSSRAHASGANHVFHPPLRKRSIRRDLGNIQQSPRPTFQANYRLWSTNEALLLRELQGWTPSRFSNPVHRFLQALSSQNPISQPLLPRETHQRNAQQDRQNPLPR